MSPKRKLFFNSSDNAPNMTKNHLKRIRIVGSIQMEQLFGFKGETIEQNIESEIFVDFLKKCLEWDPNMRATP